MTPPNVDLGHSFIKFDSAKWMALGEANLRIMSSSKSVGFEEVWPKSKDGVGIGCTLESSKEPTANFQFEDFTPIRACKT
ncbi:hypothetical protein N7527_009024 [Penicillium freii]|uniref:Uncharacterized protein n=1 Tax=Penicillium freii TaxID=48697 RepID=A0A101MBP4_PENFR|nr:hypothetical protein N7527_009024 [Penicillium freii]KUM57601.1 hypothetical protein ACN42_g9581 [Penicillium freii]